MNVKTDLCIHTGVLGICYFFKDFFKKIGIYLSREKEFIAYNL